MINKDMLKGCLCTERKISDFAIYVLCALIVILLIPILARNIPNVFIILPMLMFVVSVIPRLRALRKGDVHVLVLLAVYMLIQIFYKITGKSSAELYYYFNTVQFYFFLGAGIMMYSALTKRQIDLLLKVSLGTLLFTCLYNVILYLVYGSAEYVNLFRMDKYATNAVNTQYASGIMMVSGVAFICGMQNKKLWVKIAAFGCSAACFLFISAILQRLIVVILSVLMYLLILCFTMKTNPLNRLPAKNKKIAIGCIIGITILVIIFIVPILRLVDSMVSSERLSKRINQLVKLFETGNINEAGGSLMVRFRLMMVSLKTFTSSFATFMIGVGDHRVSNVTIGNHSLFFDELARYGILFAPVTFYLLYCALQAVRQMGYIKRGTTISRQLSALFIVIMLRCVVGTILDASVGICLFIVVPLILRTIQIQEKPETVLEKQDF